MKFPFLAEIHKKLEVIFLVHPVPYIKFCSILHQIKFVIRISDRRRKLVEVHKIAALENIAQTLLSIRLPLSQ